MQNGYAPSRLNLFGNAALLLKEGLRGIRYVTLLARNFWVKVFTSLPSNLRRPVLSLMNQFDRFAEKIDRKTSTVAHYYLDPDIARDPDTATFSKIIVKEDAPVVFAKTSYDNLKLIVVYLSEVMNIEEKFFISEMLSACAYRKSVDRFSEFAKDYPKSGLLVSKLMQMGVIRTHTSANAVNSQNENIRKLAMVSCFSNMLWLVVARDFIPEREKELLYACCDLAIVIADQIDDAGDDPEALGEILKYHAEII